MNEQYNYPVKYAVLESKEKGGWDNRYKDINQGFIASKCYVLESSIIYGISGSSSITHKVVFPYNNIQLFRQSLLDGICDIGVANTITYDMNNNPTPVFLVDELFDTYEEAKTRAIEEINSYKSRLLKSEDYEEKQKESLLQEYNKKIELSNLYEQAVLDKTNNMKITDGKDKSFEKLLKLSEKN